jgi:hypothetical protein
MAPLNVAGNVARSFPSVRLRTSMGSSPTATAMLAWWGEKASASILAGNVNSCCRRPEESHRRRVPLSLPPARTLPSGENWMTLGRSSFKSSVLLSAAEATSQRRILLSPHAAASSLPVGDTAVKRTVTAGGALRLAFAQNRLPVLGTRRRDGWIHVSSYCVRRMACLRSSAVICFHTISAFCRRGPFSGSTRRASAK